MRLSDQLSDCNPDNRSTNVDNDGHPLAVAAHQRAGPGKHGMEAVKPCCHDAGTETERRVPTVGTTGAMLPFGLPYVVGSGGR